MIRIIEIYAAFRGWLAGQVPKMFGTKYINRWVVALVRYPYPLVPPNQQIVRRHLCVYDGGESIRAGVSVWLDGATIAGPAEGQYGDIILQLHKSHAKPSSSMVVHGNSLRGK